MSEAGRSLVSRIARRLGGSSAGEGKIGSDRALFANSDLFDAGDYLQLYPDIAESGIDPLEHYVHHGVAEGRHPSRRFDAAHYVTEHPDAKDSPLRHYLLLGRQQGAAIRPVLDPTVVAIEAHGVFDSAYYLSEYPEVASSAACRDLGLHLGSITHYVNAGSREAKRPCSAFDTAFYIGRYGDVAASGLNPLLHYCEFGWRELRSPSAEFDAFAYGVLHMGCDFESISALKHFLAFRAQDPVTSAAALRSDSVNPEAVEQSFANAPPGARIDAQTALIAARWFIERKLWAGVEIAYERFLEQATPQSIHYREFARALSARGQWDRAISAFRSAAELEPQNADIHFRIGQILENQGDFAASADAFAEAARLEPGKAQRWYELGFVLQLAGDPTRSKAAYARAIAASREGAALRFGVGALHQGAERWGPAATAYGESIAHGARDAELYYRQGLALESCYEWERALDAYRTAISMRFGNSAWHYRYGYVLERLRRWAEAAQAYAACAALGDAGADQRDAGLRQGYVLAKGGDYRLSCIAYLGAWSVADRHAWPLSDAASAATGAEAIAGGSVAPFDKVAYRQQFDSVGALAEASDQDPFDAGLHADLGQLHEASGDMQGAIADYRQAVARSDHHLPDAHYRLGRVLAAEGQFEMAAEAFADIMAFQSPTGVGVKSLKLTARYNEIAEYCDFRETLPVLPNVILYESYGGVSMACNPYAIFRRIVDAEGFSEKLHVWVLNNKADADPAYLRRKNVVFVTRNSRLHRRYMATAGYLIHNSSFPALFVRRPEQRYLNTWHGTPLKTLGRDIKGNFMERRHSVRSRLQATHLINPNAHTTYVLMDRCDIAGLFAGQVAETGYPRNDVLVDADDARRQAVRTRLGVSGSAKVVLYAPTWRGILFHPEVNPDKLIADLSALAGLDCEIVFRGHYFAEQALKDSAIPVHVAPHALDTADLLAITDVLVTDYSSVFFDFLPTRRPILFYTYDLDQYVEERGLYFDMHDMPGPLCSDIDTLRETLSGCLGRDFVTDEKYERAIERFATHEDGCATRRTIDFFFNDSVNNVAQPERRGPTMLVYAGDFDPQDSDARAAAQCVEQLAEKGDITLFIDPDKVGGRSRDRTLFDKLPDSIRVIGRIGARTGSAEERWVMAQFATQVNELPSGQMDVYSTVYGREFERILGAATFDFALNLSPDDEYWSSLLAFGGHPKKRIMMKRARTKLQDDLHGAKATGLERYYDSVLVVDAWQDTSSGHNSILECVFEKRLAK